MRRAFVVACPLECALTTAQQRVNIIVWGAASAAGSRRPERSLG
jgi:hypothetical protein